MDCRFRLTTMMCVELVMMKNNDDDNIRHRRKKENDKIEKARRKDVRLLEVGAINTQLIEAAARMRVRTRRGERLCS